MQLTLYSITGNLTSSRMSPSTLASFHSMPSSITNEMLEVRVEGILYGIKLELM